MNVNDGMAQAERLHKTGRAEEALAIVVRALGCRQDYWMYQAAVQYACSAGDAAKAQLYFPSAPAAFQPILEAQCKQNHIGLRPPPVTENKPAPQVDPCEGIDTDGLAQQAVKLYSDGAAKAALATVQKALACKQDDRLLRFAVVYACVAHDVATAKLYFAKVADAFKPNLEQKCQQEGLDVRAP